MKRTILIATSLILLTAGNVGAKPNTGSTPGNDKKGATQNANKMHLGATRLSNAAACLHYKPVTRFGTIPVYTNNFGFDNVARHTQRKHLLPITCFATSYAGKRLIYNAPLPIAKPVTVTVAPINKDVVLPATVDCSGLLGCDNDNGVNIGISDKATISVDFSDADEMANYNSFSNPYTSHDMDISVSLVVALR